MVKAADVNWLDYFKSIRVECPWSLRAYEQGLIDIVTYTGEIFQLGHYQARIYIVNAPNETIEALSHAMKHHSDEWLFSYPGYGEFAAPVGILIQQDRARLAQLRSRLSENCQDIHTEPVISGEITK